MPKMAILNYDNCCYLPAVIFVILFSIGGGLIALEGDDSNCADSTLETLPDYDPGWPASFGIGTIATIEEIKAWDFDVTADGTGAARWYRYGVCRQKTLADHCARVATVKMGRGKPFDALAGHGDAQSYPFPDNKYAVKTIGNYWPYATTLFDYIYRSMPFATPGSLNPDEVYSISAYLLYLNNLMPEETILTAEKLASIEMPARNRFVAEGRCNSK